MATKNKTQTKPEDVDAEDAAPAAPAPRRRLPFKPILLAAGGLVALLAVGGGAYHLMESRTAAATTGPGRPAVFLDMPDVLVNLSASGGERTQYLKVKVTLELPDQAMQAQIQPVMPRLTDAFQTYLRELRPTDLDGSAGLYRLKEELTRRVNAAIAPGRINAVLFKEIVVQ
jgi:flagellar protein FliL